MAKGRFVAGIDLGGTNMQIGVVGPGNKVVGRAKKKTRAGEGSDRVLDRLVDGVHEACQAAGLTVRDLSAVGIGAPGAIDPAHGVVLEAVNLRWNNYPLSRVLSRKFGHHVVVDNDVNVAVYGEHQLGAAKGVRDTLGVWIGTGIGGGLILHNQLFYGATFTAGEIGHTILFPGNPPGSRSLENNCSRTALVDRLVRLIRANNPSIITDLAEGEMGDFKAKVIAQAYAKGDKLTRQVVDNAAYMLGISIANVVTLLGIQHVVLGGGLTESMGDDLVIPVRDAVRAHVFPAVCRKVEVVGTKLGPDAGLLGAALLARKWVEGKALPATGRKKKA